MDAFEGHAFGQATWTAQQDLQGKAGRDEKTRSPRYLKNIEKHGFSCLEQDVT